jgi:predicted RNA-binding protein associated with RNAse of E/G family
MRSRQQTRLEGWYINVQRPVEVAERGFAYMDRTLDVVVSPALGSWRLKDEDELERAVEIGLYGRDDVSEIRQAAMNGLAFLRDRASQLRSLQDSPHLKSDPLKVDFREVWT